MGETILINRAPVFTLWAAVCAERQGHDRGAALSLAKVAAGLNAQAKGRAIGLFVQPAARGGGEPQKTGLGEEFWVTLCGRAVPAKQTGAGVRGVVKDQPVEPDKVEAYLQSKFGAQLAAVRAAMEELAGRFMPEQLAECAYGLYEQFRPQIARGQAGWGQKGELDLELVRRLAGQAAAGG